MTTATESTGQAKRGRWRAKLVPGAILLAGMATVCVIALMPSAQTSTPPVERVPVNVKVTRVEPIPEITDTFDLTAVVEPYTVVRVSAEVSGRLERYGTRVKEATWEGGLLPAGSAIKEGQPVSEGDPIIILNRDLIQARFDRASAQYEYDQREYERVLSLFERGNASSTEMRLARTRRDVSKADLDEVSRSLARTTIVAPSSGILNDWFMDPGEYASAGDPVAEIVDIEKVKVHADVPEREIAYLHVGQTAEILLQGADADSLTGTITYINALADQVTRTTRIEVTVENRLPGTATRSASPAAGRWYRLRSGQIVNMRLTRRILHGVTMIPLASVIPLENGKEVYVVVDGKAERRRIDLGFIRGRSIQVISGLNAGDLLILEGHRLVSPGQPVNIISPDGGSPGSAVRRATDTAPAAIPTENTP